MTSRSLVATRRARRGTVLLLLAVCFSSLFGFAALAFDLGYLYVTSTQLSIATDAAAMGAIRHVQDGADIMTVSAQRIFQANLPDGRLLITNAILATPTTSQTTAGTTVSVSSTATAPLFFAGIFGKTEADLAATARATRRDKNVILVMDYSGSLNAELPAIKNALKLFVDEFAEGSDNLGLVTYSKSARIDFAPQTTFKAGMHEQIDNIITLGGSDMPLGLWYGYKALRELVDPLKPYKLNTMNRSREVLLGQVPDPRRAVADHDLFRVPFRCESEQLSKQLRRRNRERWMRLFSDHGGQTGRQAEVLPSDGPAAASDVPAQTPGL